MPSFFVNDAARSCPARRPCPKLIDQILMKLQQYKDAMVYANYIKKHPTTVIHVVVDGVLWLICFGFLYLGMKNSWGT